MFGFVESCRLARHFDSFRKFAKVIETDFIECKDWPVLGWLAVCYKKENKLSLYHGSRVEVNQNWICEAVWDGEYSEGAFDQTDIVHGSGVRFREDAAIFVSSCATVDRLQYIEFEERVYVSNSLAALVNATGLIFKPGYEKYRDDIDTVIKGVDQCQELLQADNGVVHLIYMDNLRWDGAEITRLPKSRPNRDFSSYSHYKAFLDGTFKRICNNQSDPQRQFPYQMTTTLSSGYDSTMVATLAAEQGCRDAFSFDYTQGNYREDTGEAAADALGLRLKVIDRECWQDIDFSEVPFIASDANGEDRYYAAASDLVAGKVVFTGYHGDKIWDKDTDEKYLNDKVMRGDSSGLSLTEFRLSAGFINCPVPFWGVRQISDVVHISRSPEMADWDVGNNYSRPICRRIAESAGISRESFGIKKKAASVQMHTRAEFMTSGALRDYLDWLKQNRWALAKQAGFPLIVSYKLDQAVYKCMVGYGQLFILVRKLLAKIPGLWKFSNSRWLIEKGFLNQRIEPYYLRKYIFPWALGRAAKYYPLPNQLTGTQGVDSETADHEIRETRVAS